VLGAGVLSAGGPDRAELVIDTLDQGALGRLSVAMCLFWVGGAGRRCRGCGGGCWVGLVRGLGAEFAGGAPPPLPPAGNPGLLTARSRPARLWRRRPPPPHLLPPPPQESYLAGMAGMAAGGAAAVSDMERKRLLQRRQAQEARRQARLERLRRTGVAG
jgi:hypothetical protein